MSRGLPSKRDRIRDECEGILANVQSPLHFTQLAELVFPKLELETSEYPKTLNTALHEDPRQRFRRVGRGTWVLAQPNQPNQ